MVRINPVSWCLKIAFPLNTNHPSIPDVDPVTLPTLAPNPEGFAFAFGRLGYVKTVDMLEFTTVDLPPPLLFTSTR